MLTQSIAKGDFATASELLRAHGHSGVNRGEAGEPGGAAKEPAKEPIPLDKACEGTVVQVVTHAGPVACYRLRRTLEQVAPDCLDIARQYSAVLRGARQVFGDEAALKASAALCHVADAAPGDLLFMDCETCGLSGTAIFLVGMMAWQDGQLAFEQMLARDYSEEPAILRAFADRFEQAGVLVTFNGKSFDMSMIRERCAFHGVELAHRRVPHLDLLHESRKRWRGEVPNCKLQTLEKHLCRRHRVGDIPGAEIPDAYHRFVASGDARQVRDILHHNLLDMLTMAQIVVALLTGSAPLVE